MSSLVRHRGRRAVWTALILAAIVPHAALAQEVSSPPLQVQVSAVGPSGVDGIVLLSPAAGGTAVQALVVGAPTGTTAVIQIGSCGSPEGMLAALLGDVSAGGQVQVKVPIAFATLTDGGHVVSLHPGLDMTMQLGCGTIPAVAAIVPIDADPNDTPVAPVAAPPTPEPTPEPPVAQPPPTPDPGCAGLEAWVSASEGSITRISEALADLNTVAGRGDLVGYLSGLASLEGELRVMVARQAQEFAPEAATDVNTQLVRAYETYIDAARQIYDALTINVDATAYSRAVARYEEANTLVGEIQRDMGELKGRCALT